MVRKEVVEFCELWCLVWFASCAALCILVSRNVL